MKYRGKGIRWTESEDRMVLEGQSPEGRTPSQVRNRRSKLKLNFGHVTIALCGKLLKRVDYMSRMDLFKPQERKSLRTFADSIKKLL